MGDLRADSPQTLGSHDVETPRRRAFRRRHGAQLVVLNVYDINNSGTIQSLNDIFRAVGTGFFHVGLHVYASEWSFGFAEGQETGVCCCKPREYFLGRYRETVVLGRTFHTEIAVLDIIEQMSVAWPGHSYDLLHRNCAHFCSLLCNQICTGSVPIWVTNMAVVGATLSAGMEIVSSKVQSAAAVVEEGLDKLDSHRAMFHESGMFSARGQNTGQGSVNAGMEVVSSNVKTAAATVAEGLDSLNSNGRIHSVVESVSASVMPVVGDEHDIKEKVTGAFSSWLSAAREADDTWKISESIGNAAQLLVAATGELNEAYQAVRQAAWRMHL